MRFPCEFVSASLLPGLRVRITHNLRQEGYSQNEIAKILGVKQPVIVSYLQKTVDETGDERINHHLNALADTVSEMIISKENIDPIMRSICSKCKSLRVSGPICSIHKEILPEIAHIKNCSICSGSKHLPSIEKRSTIIQSLEEVFEILKKNPTFYKWIPEIGSQVACCDSDASQLDDVASFPGRIIKVKEQIFSVHPPEFGSSKTSSSLLLWFKKNRPDIKWIISIKTKENLKQIFKDKGIKFIETEHLDSATTAVLKTLEKGNKIFEIQAIMDKASSGFESITYLFASDKNNILDLVQVLD
ncbi:MAG: thiamine-phosphate synthase family protein [Candidatus Heimdallarchaeaceae archaeon]